MQPDVILMDVSMPDMDGVEATRRSSSATPTSEVVMLTMHADQDVIDARHQGRRRRLPHQGLLAPTRSPRPCAMAANGETALSPQLAEPMLDEVRKLDSGAEREEDRIVTKREEEVLQLIADGCSTPEVAEKLYISQKTVKNHLASIYEKLNARDRTQAVLLAVRMGIVKLTVSSSADRSASPDRSGFGAVLGARRAGSPRRRSGSASAASASASALGPRPRSARASPSGGSPSGYCS